MWIRKQALNIYRLSKTPKKYQPSIKQVKSLWDQFSTDYNKFDYCPQTLYYSLLYMSEVWEAQNILEVACGTGKLLPMAMNMKNPAANYLAVDLSPNMINLTKENLQRNLELYGSKLDLENWMNKNNLFIDVADAQQPIKRPNIIKKRFDRIICNCVLMLTSDSQKMLKNLYNQAEPGCLLGLSVWGNKQNNNLMSSIRQSYLQANVELPEERSNFHLYKKVPKLAESCGWDVVLGWEQNALFPAFSANSEKYKSFFFHQVQKVEEGKKERVKEILMKKLNKYFEEEKKGLNFSCQLFILRKK